MDNIEKLKHIGILGEIRQRMGGDDENDEQFDSKINRLDNNRLIKEWCGWKLGSGEWWTDMKQMFDDLEQLSGKPKGLNERIADALHEEYMKPNTERPI